MKESHPPSTIPLGLLGAAIGGYLGYQAFFWITKQGFYALLVPPAFLGLTAGLFVRRRSIPLAVICGISGLALALFTEWRFAPFSVDGSLSYFIAHIHELKPITLGLAVIGSILSYRLALGFDRSARN